MTQKQHIDPERLAALLDGRLGNAEAVTLRAQLADADEDTVGAYADAIAIAQSLERDAGGSETSRAEIVPLPSRPMWRSRVAASLMAAAVVAGVFVTWQRARTPNGATAYEVALYASAVPAGAILNDPNLWGARRGGGDVLTDRARAARVGVWLAHLAIRESRGAPDLASAGEIARLVGDLPGGSSVGLEFGNLATSGLASSVARRTELGEHAFALLDGGVVNAAGWLEAARLAAGAGDRAFFSRFPPSLVLTPLQDSKELSVTERANVTELLVLGQSSDADLRALQTSIEALLGSLTR